MTNKRVENQVVNVSVTEVTINSSFFSVIIIENSIAIFPLYRPFFSQWFLLSIHSCILFMQISNNNLILNPNWIIIHFVSQYIVFSIETNGISLYARKKKIKEKIGRKERKEKSIFGNRSGSNSRQTARNQDENWQQD